MTITYARRVRGGWETERVEATPTEAKAARAKHEETKRQATAAGKSMFQFVKIGDRAYCHSSGTLSELYEAGMEPFIGGTRNEAGN